MTNTDTREIEMFTPEILKKIRSEIEASTNEWGSPIVDHDGYIEDAQQVEFIVIKTAAKENLLNRSNLTLLGHKLMLALDCGDADADHDGGISLDEFMEHLKNIE